MKFIYLLIHRDATLTEIGSAGSFSRIFKTNPEKKKRKKKCRRKKTNEKSREGKKISTELDQAIFAPGLQSAIYTCRSVNYTMYMWPSLNRNTKEFFFFRTSSSFVFNLRYPVQLLFSLSGRGDNTVESAKSRLSLKINSAWWSRFFFFIVEVTLFLLKSTTSGTILG